MANYSQRTAVDWQKFFRLGLLCFGLGCVGLYMLAFAAAAPWPWFAFMGLLTVASFALGFFSFAVGFRRRRGG